MTGFNKVMRFCNTLQDYESAKNQGTITDDLFVVILQDKLAKFKGQTFDWSQNADLTALATKGELEDLAEEIASNERVWAEALNDLNERINNIGTGGGGGGGTSDIVVDAALSTTSTNAIQNKAVANALNEKADASALASKQDTLVSGTNIKTVQGQSILGSGNISISVPTVDAELSSTSTNAVQNKVVTEMLAALGGYSDLAGYIRAYTDADGRFLWGIKEDGSIEWSKGVPAPVIEFIEPKITEVTQSISDLSQSFSAMMEEVSSVSEKINEIGEYAADTEYIRKYVDENDVFLWGIKEDGSIEWGKGVPTPVQEFVAEQVAVIMNKFDIYEALFNTLSHDIKQLNNIVSYKADGRWIYAIAGEDNRVVLGIDANGNICGQGFKVEEKIHFSESAMTELQKDLRTSGFQVDSPIDWSSESSITLPFPRACAKVNIISSSGLATSKTEDKVCQLEYYDKDGNYFKKYIVLNAQGSSSMAYIEKNQSIDVFNDEACEESCEITFGNWVTQDSFHLKCYYIDVFRGIANIAYNFSEEVIQYVGSRNNRIIFDTDAINTSNSTGDFDTDFGDGALCHPDGFPFEMYANGEYYGLFAWNLKKHRKNYSMSKNSYNQILLDGKIGADELFGGVIDWTAFELRNPKDLVTMDGKKYDADTNCNELIDSSSSVYDPSNPVHVKTAECKSLIIRQSNAIAAISGESNESLARELFETYYDKNAMMVYTIVSNVFYHLDGFWKNWIWTIYGNIAAPSFYDLDSIFGRNTRGTGVEDNSLINVVLGTDTRYPTGQLFRLYKTELDEMYADLRKNNIISVDNIMGYVSDWTARVGRNAYERNIKAWPSIPSYRNQKNEEDGTTDTGGMFDSPIRVRKWLENRLTNLDQYFNKSNY